ncbi:MAG: endonuclease domain-containing protein [Candidatus Sericytochromatia bacterium]
MNTEQVRALRRNMTGPERRLWAALRGRSLGVKFRRQAPISCYIVDFACLERRLIIEVDGGQHAESEHDQRRDSVLRSQGYTVLRFWNHEVMRNLPGVVEVIIGRLERDG